MTPPSTARSVLANLLQAIELILVLHPDPGPITLPREYVEECAKRLMRVLALLMDDE